MSGLASLAQGASAPAGPGQLAAEIRRRLGPAPERREWPLVSIVVLNRDGAGLLRRLLHGLAERTDYPALELIVVDNASGDDSLPYLRTVEAPFPISILANAHNESFSEACNQGAELASGELLLFLNNDVEPFEPGWLRELVACLGESGAGAVGASLLCPEDDGGSDPRYVVQTRPLRFSATAAGTIGIHDPGRGRDVLAAVGEDVESALAFGAAILIGVDVFRQVGGFTRGYWYGCEDTDLMFKVRSRGLRDLYSGRSFVIHHAASTSGKLDAERGARNLRLLGRRWAPRVWRECRLDRDGALWSAPRPAAAGREKRASDDELLALGFCLKADSVGEDRAALLGRLEAGLRRLGHRCLALRDSEVDDPRAHTHDVAVHFQGSRRYVPRSGQLNVLWLGDELDTAREIECRRYQLAIAPAAELAARLREGGQAVAHIAADDPDLARTLRDAVLRRARELEWPTRIGPP